MVAFIVVYIYFSSVLAYSIFMGEPEEIQYFPGGGVGVWNMLVLITTSNYPDIMIPTYKENRITIIFFALYLKIGVFLLMNLLLATLYSKYKSRFSEYINLKEDLINEYLFKEFKKFCDSDKNYLN